MRNRKFTAFIITLIIAAILSYFGKETSGVVAIAGLYFTANVMNKKVIQNNHNGE